MTPLRISLAALSAFALCACASTASDPDLDPAPVPASAQVSQPQAALEIATTQPRVVWPVGQGVPPGIGFSGIARLDDTTLLVVHDVKSGKPGERLGLIQRLEDEEGIGYEPLLVDWKSIGVEEAPSDLEAVCPVPGLPNHYLLCESGYHRGKFGRILQLEISATEGGWRVLHQRTIQLPQDTNNLEGLVAFPLEGGLGLILGERGGSKKTPQGQLRGFRLKDDGSFQKLFEHEFKAPDWSDEADNRDISDLYLLDDGRLLCSSAEDPGDDGPFRSVVYEVGVIGRGVRPGLVLYPAPRVLFRLDGIKVEGLGPSFRGLGDVSIASDDEAYGGVWRGLPVKK